MENKIEKKPYNYWTKERCIEFAKQAKTSADVRKLSHSVYRKMRDNGWFVECDWLKVNNYKEKGYWDYDHCFEAALNCFNRRVFKKNYPTAYEHARKNGWINDYTWFPPKQVWKEQNYLVYSYEDKDNKVVYVGLTHDLYLRHRSHKLGFVYKGKKTYDSVYNHFHSIGKEVPDVKIKIDGLYAEDAQYYEDWYRNAYEANGWTLLNVRPTGVGKSSLGGSKLKWDREACYNEAKKYTTKVDFKRGCIGAYNNAIKYKWIDYYTWFEELVKPIGYWTYERVTEEAKKCATKKEFREKSKGAYKAAVRNKWIGDLFPSNRKPAGYWDNYENCKKEALKYKTRAEFCDKCISAYHRANKNGWLDDFFGGNNDKPAGYWTKDRVIEEAKKHRSKKQMERECGGAYSAAKRNKWLGELVFNKAA